MYYRDNAERLRLDNLLSYAVRTGWCSWGIISSSLCIRTHSFRIRTVVKFYNSTLQLRYECIPMQYSHFQCFLKEINAHQQTVVLKKPLTLQIQQPNT